MEHWKQIKGFDNYWVSSFGRVRSSKNYGPLKTRNVDGTRFLRLYKKSSGRSVGYHFVFLYKKGANGKSQRFMCYVHRLVAQAFHDNPENKPQVNHIDANTLNNRASNLEWVTCSENIRHSIAIGTYTNQRGQNNNASKLTRRQVELILKSDESHHELSKKFGVSRGAISLIKAGKRWGHVKV